MKTEIDAMAFVWSCVVLLAMGSQLGAAEPDVPLLNRQGGAGLSLAPAGGTDASARVVGEWTWLTFRISQPERRLAALEGLPGGKLAGMRALVFEGRLAVRQGKASLVVVCLEDDGGAWYRVSDKALPRVEFAEIRLPLGGGFQRARFAADEDEAISWDQLDRVWLGLLVDGPADGAMEVRQLRFTNEPLHPTEPASVGGTWTVSQDSAVKSKLESTEVDGVKTMEYRFDLPGGRHMFALPQTPVDVEELDGYSGLRFTYRADLPPGIDGLLVMLLEGDGTQYRAVPAPPGSTEWKTVTIPFDKFERGSWSKDENDRLDLCDVRRVAIGMHGTTPEATGGTIAVRDVEFVP